MSSSYQIKITRYRAVKDQTNKFEENRQRNELIKKKREDMTREKQ